MPIPLSEHADQVRVDINALVRRADLLSRSFGEAADSLASHRDRLAATPSIMPTQGWLTSAFQSMREHPILHMARPHEGIDVASPDGHAHRGAGRRHRGVLRARNRATAT